MIIRFWLVFGIALTVLAWALQVPLAPAPFQASASTAVTGYREAGLMPPAGALTMSEEIGHDVFEVPDTDAAYLRAAQVAAGKTGMAGMQGASGVSGAPGQAGMPGTAAGGQGMSGAKPGTAGRIPPERREGAMSGPDKGSGMPGMAEKKDHGAAEEGEDEDHGGGGLGIIGAGAAAPVDRTIEIEMSEWGFSPSKIDVKHGEVVRLVVRNAGNVPHEFMLMTGPAMQAVRYRLQRADWNLTEHEAVFEQPVSMPGDRFEVVVRIEQPGMWMFMCMFPYHMRLGMMGSMRTAGMAGMKM